MVASVEVHCVEVEGRRPARHQNEVGDFGGVESVRVGVRRRVDKDEVGSVLAGSVRHEGQAGGVSAGDLRGLALAAVSPSRGGCLRIDVDDSRRITRRSRPGREVNRDCRFSHAALLGDYRNGFQSDLPLKGDDVVTGCHDRVAT